MILGVVTKRIRMLFYRSSRGCYNVINIEALTGDEQGTFNTGVGSITRILIIYPGVSVF